MVCLSRPYHFEFFKSCLPQILLGPFQNTWPIWTVSQVFIPIPFIFQVINNCNTATDFHSTSCSNRSTQHHQLRIFFFKDILRSIIGNASLVKNNMTTSSSIMKPMHICEHCILKYSFSHFMLSSLLRYIAWNDKKYTETAQSRCAINWCLSSW